MPEINRKQIMNDSLTTKQIEDSLVYLDGWRYEKKHLIREFEFDTADEVGTFVQQVAAVSEEANHHPDVTTDDLHITIRLQSHDAKGVTGRDIELAESIQDLEP